MRANHSLRVVDAGHSARPSRTDPSRPRPSRIEAISTSQQDLGKARKPPAEAKPHLSIFIDESIEAAEDDTAEAVKTDWEKSKLDNAGKSGSLDFSGH